MRRAALFALLLAAGVAARADEEQQGHAPDTFGICTQDVKDEDELIHQGFVWVEDAPTVARLTSRLAEHLACAAKSRKSKNPCAALEKMQPAFHYTKEIGTIRAECEWLNSYADFWWEVMGAAKNQRAFPSCEDHLNRLDAPVKFFNLKAKAPRSADPDPTNDGGFWNLCKVVGERMRAGRSDVCEPRVKYYLGSDVPPDLWKPYCDSVAKLWVQGDESFCDLQKPNDDSCRLAAQMTRAFREKSRALCPSAGVARGICLEKLASRNQPACAQTWQELQNDFCAERARHKLDTLPKPKGGGGHGKKPAPKGKPAAGGADKDETGNE